MHTHIHLYDWIFAPSIGCQVKKNPNSLRFSEMTQRTGKSECSSVFEQTFLITSVVVWSVLVWWQPHLEREQVRLCDNSIKSMMERSLKKHSVCSIFCLYVASIQFGCKTVMSSSPSCCWDYMNKGMLPCLAFSAFSRYSLQILDYQNRALLMQQVLVEHPVPIRLERAFGAFPGCHIFPQQTVQSCPVLS